MSRSFWLSHLFNMVAELGKIKVEFGEGQSWDDFAFHLENRLFGMTLSSRTTLEREVAQRALKMLGEDPSTKQTEDFMGEAQALDADGNPSDDCLRRVPLEWPRTC